MGGDLIVDLALHESKPPDLNSNREQVQPTVRGVNLSHTVSFVDVNSLGRNIQCGCQQIFMSFWLPCISEVNAHFFLNRFGLLKNEEIRNVHFFKGAFGQCEYHFNIKNASS